MWVNSERWVEKWAKVSLLTTQRPANTGTLPRFAFNLAYEFRDPLWPLESGASDATDLSIQF